MKPFSTIFDILFPPSLKEVHVRSLSPQTLRAFPTPQEVPHNFIHASLPYHHSDVQTLVSELKYQARKHALDLAASIMTEDLVDFLVDRQQFGAFQHPYISYVPMYKSKKRERGWNQSQLLAKRIARNISCATYTRVLKKVKNTKRQTEVASRSKRLENVHNSFNVTRGVGGKEIILIDDVTTTGATLYECQQLLLENGAYRVVAFTVAH